MSVLEILEDYDMDDGAMTRLNAERNIKEILLFFINNLNNDDVVEKCLTLMCKIFFTINLGLDFVKKLFEEMNIKKILLEIMNKYEGSLKELACMVYCGNEIFDSVPPEMEYLFPILTGIMNREISNINKTDFSPSTLCFILHTLSNFRIKCFSKFFNFAETIDQLFIVFEQKDYSLVRVGGFLLWVLCSIMTVEEKKKLILTKLNSLFKYLQI
jgi:hypothetical protein